MRDTCPVCGSKNLMWGDKYTYYGKTYHPYKCNDCKLEGAEYEQPAMVDPNKFESKFIDSINEKIREAEQCDDPDITQEYLTGYTNGLKMALQILKEQEL